jgi:hypothetical protein
MFFDIEKEEQWLNEQLQKGYRCTNISGLGIYTFEKTDKKYVKCLHSIHFLRAGIKYAITCFVPFSKWRFLPQLSYKPFSGPTLQQVQSSHACLKPCIIFY